MDTIDTILTADCLTVLPTLPAGVAPLACFDPPFGQGMDYPDYDDRRPDFALYERTLRELRRILTPDGSLWVQCGQRIQARMYRLLEEMGLHFQNSVPWYYEFGPYQKRKLAPCWQMLHWFTVHPKNFTFNGGDLRVPSRRQEGRDKRADPRGRILPDVWDLKRISGTFKARRGHCCQTNELVNELVVLLCSNPGDLVLDPMAGTGTTLLAAKLWGRRFLGIEKCAETAAKARCRLANATPPLFV